jgi:putative transposase
VLFLQSLKFRVGLMCLNDNMIELATKVVRPEVCLLASRRSDMPRKKCNPDAIAAQLRQVDVLVSQGRHIADAIRQIGVNEVTYLKELEQENTRLRRAISELTLDKIVVQEGVRENF